MVIIWLAPSGTANLASKTAPKKSPQQMTHFVLLSFCSFKATLTSQCKRALPVQLEQELHASHEDQHCFLGRSQWLLAFASNFQNVLAHSNQQQVCQMFLHFFRAMFGWAGALVFGHFQLIAKMKAFSSWMLNFKEETMLKHFSIIALLILARYED